VQARVLVADSGSGWVAELTRALETEGYLVELVAPERLGSELLEELARLDEGPDALLLEAGGSGAARLRTLLEVGHPPVVAVFPPGSRERPGAALRAGADDVVTLPVDREELALRVARAIERHRVAREVEKGRPSAARACTPAMLLGETASVRRVREQIARVAPGSATVLITGETGAGKELVATAIHENSPRRHRPFLKVNCAALPEPLLESELFGHERGAFTGADQRRIGRFEEADGGTLLLDEVGDMQPRTQAKVLRVLQEREFERLGGSRPIRVDVRILAATNQDLQQLIAEGRFRADLFYRLNVVSIHLPPLRERREDIRLLAEVFLLEFNRETPRPKRGFSPAALEVLESYDWPGSVRELRNTVQRAVLMGEGPWIAPADLGVSAGSHSHGASSPGSFVSLPDGGVDYREVERAVITQALEKTGWVQKKAAAFLRMSRRRLNYRIQRLGISHPGWRRNRS
jgi:DNA-binding NtrC family response regulator